MQKAPLSLRPFQPQDQDALWQILGPIIRDGCTYALPHTWEREEALAYWLDPSNRVYVAVTQENEIVGTFYLKPNQKGGGSHVANAGFMARPGFGAGRALGRHAISEASRLGYRAIQFNFVVSTNLRAIALWKSLGFRVLATLPDAFDHPQTGYVDVFVMWQDLLPARQETSVAP